MSPSSSSSFFRFPEVASSALIRVLKDSSEYRPAIFAAFENMNEHAIDVPLALLKTKDDAAARREAARVLVQLAPRFKQNP